ncbi:MAG: class I SAM-dependent methyltransferase [Desulfobacterales bacterium]|jgi:2-polyprenyl-3-methyl-5-hydroxy-6-metoxy-1,4-benzoquinol methylase
MIDLHHRKECPICSCPDSILLCDAVPTINEASDLTIELRECTACGHWWNTPCPTQEALIDLYKSASPYVIGKHWEDDIRRPREEGVFHIMINTFRPDMSDLRYLEVGCGGGHLIRSMREKVGLCYGIEPGSWASETEGIVGEIDQIPKNLAFDILVFQDVIEHTENPIDTLKMYTERARTGATLFVAFPNKDAPPAQREKEGWDMIRPFGHLQYFSRKSLSLLMKKAGWEIVKLRKGPNRFPLTEFKTYNPFRTLKRLRNNDQWYVQAIKK